VPRRSRRPQHDAVTEHDAGYRCLSGGRFFASAGNWASSDQAFAISRGSRDASARHLGLTVGFLAGCCPFDLSDPGKAIRPRNVPSSSSRLRRGYDKAPRGALLEKVKMPPSLLLSVVHRAVGATALRAGEPRPLGEVDPQIKPLGGPVELHAGDLPRLCQTQRGLEQTKILRLHAGSHHRGPEARQVLSQIGRYPRSSWRSLQSAVGRLIAGCSLTGTSRLRRSSCLTGRRDHEATAALAHGTREPGLMSRGGCVVEDNGLASSTSMPSTASQPSRTSFRILLAVGQGWLGSPLAEVALASRPARAQFIDRPPRRHRREERARATRAARHPRAPGGPAAAPPRPRLLPRRPCSASGR